MSSWRRGKGKSTRQRAERARHFRRCVIVDKIANALLFVLVPSLVAVLIAWRLS